MTRNKEINLDDRFVTEGIDPSKKTLEEVFKESKSRIHRIYLYFYRLFWRIVRLPGDIRRNIRDFIQRGRRGWANSDIWSFDYYLSKVIAKGLYHLKEHRHSHPGDLTEGQWVDILNKMINTFKIMRRISEGSIIYIPSKEFSERKYKQWCKVIKDINKKHSIYDRVLTKKQSKELEEGFRLFQQYFFNLWD